MLLNEDLNAEVKNLLKEDGYNLAALGRKLGMRSQIVSKVLKAEMIGGRWIELLDVAGYDVQVVIKRKKKR